MIQRERVLQEYEMWLGKIKWDLYITITFRRETSDIVAIRKFKYFLQHLNDKGKYYYPKYVKGWLFVEKHNTRDSFHIHAFVKNIDTMNAEEIQKRCIKVFGQSKVEPYDPSRKGILYLVGKIGRDSLAHYEPFSITGRKIMPKEIRATFSARNHGK